MVNKSLFELSEEILGLDALLDSVEDDDPEGQRAILEGYMSTLEDDLQHKLDNYAAFITELEARAAARKAEAERVLHRSKVDANKAERLKAVLKWFFQTHEMTKYETARYRVSLCANGGKLPLLLNPDLLTEEYLNEIVSYVPDSDRIREALESGQQVPGAMLGERDTHLRIK